MHHACINTLYKCIHKCSNHWIKLYFLQDHLTPTAHFKTKQCKYSLFWNVITAAENADLSVIIFYMGG